MSKLSDILVYLCEQYPHKHELSKARLTKMVYLADWRSSIDRGKQMTDLVWVFNHYGPYLDDVVRTAKETRGLEVTSTQNMYGKRKDLVQRVGQMPAVELSQSERDVLDTVIRETEQLHWNGFIELVYSTYPVVTQERYVDLDLPQLALNYNQQKTAFA
ncbi:Panacea domain-containing protein [Rhodococcus erythropolis]|uniref:Panacea domain-containing protein n=1 Tax=Rhodococcus erythropolis TaxID=1833 RepID=UPI0022B34223|nr:Panacea domain-containing protein [Rhodococcus erythropolis]MCZ4567245.1 Panacea domain-containing protein [Rhodococcus erythropolis]